MKKFYIPVLVFLLPYAVLFTYDDVSAYYGNVNNDGCCGWVDSDWYKRPYTYLMIDEWSEPKWKLNAVKSEEWLVSDGFVNDKVEFWTILEYRDPKTKLPLLNKN